MERRTGLMNPLDINGDLEKLRPMRAGNASSPSPHMMMIFSGTQISLHCFSSNNAFGERNISKYEYPLSFRPLYLHDVYIYRKSAILSAPKLYIRHATLDNA
jgi:hypothetical protein